MNRFGIAGQVADCVKEQVKCGIEVEEYIPTWLQQLLPIRALLRSSAQLLEVIKSLEEQELHIPLKHICNSASSDLPRCTWTWSVLKPPYGQYPLGSSEKLNLRTLDGTCQDTQVREFYPVRL